MLTYRNRKELCQRDWHKHVAGGLYNVDWSGLVCGVVVQSRAFQRACQRPLRKDRDTQICAAITHVITVITIQSADASLSNSSSVFFFISSSHFRKMLYFIRSLHWFYIWRLLYLLHKAHNLSKQLTHGGGSNPLYFLQAETHIFKYNLCNCKS